MAIDKAVDSSRLNADLKAIADAIRTKGGTSDALTFPGGFVDAVGAIQAGTGGDDTSMEDGLIEGTISTYENDRVEVVRSYCFAYTQFTHISLPNVVSFAGSNNFNSAAIVTIDLPKLERVAGGNVFKSCAALGDIKLPSLTGSLPSFQVCTSFVKGDFYNDDLEHVYDQAIGGSTFNGCTNLKKIILRKKTGIITLVNVNAFANTPFASGGTGGTVYVPSALIESYQAATNWSTLYAAGTCTFSAIEGSEYE